MFRREGVMSRPIYQMIMEELRNEIQTAEPNTPILSERELEKKYEASRMTIRKALELLVEEGVLYRVQNVGTFVSDQKLQKKSTTNLVANSFNTERDYKIIYFDVKDNDREVARHLEISLQDQFIRIVRLNLKDNQQESIDQIYIVRQMIADADMNNIHKIFEFSANIVTGSVNQTFIPINVPVIFANLLGLKINTPIIRIDSKVITKSGRVYAYIQTLMHPKTSIEITV